MPLMLLHAAAQVSNSLTITRMVNSGVCVCVSWASEARLGGSHGCLLPRIELCVRTHDQLLRSSGCSVLTFRDRMRLRGVAGFREAGAVLHVQHSGVVKR